MLFVLYTCFPDCFPDCFVFVGALWLCQTVDLKTMSFAELTGYIVEPQHHLEGAVVHIVSPNMQK
jgi:hypothetical protein